MGYILKVPMSTKALATLACFGILAVAAIFAPRVSALTMSDILNQPKILGDTTSNPYPYPTASLVNDNGTIYFISGTTKIPFTNYKAFTGLGYSLRNVVKGDLSSYNPSQSYAINTANAAHPWGSWISYNKVVYYSAQTGMIGVPSAEVFLSNGGEWNLVVKANKYDLALLKTGGAPAVLTDNDPRVAGQPTLRFNGSTPSQNNPANLSSGSGGSSANNTVPTSTLSVIIPQNIYASSTATFNVTSADPNLPLIYTFAWDDGSPSNSVTANSVVHTYYLPGLYYLSLTQTDFQNNTVATTIPLTVLLPPNQTPSVPQFSLPTGIIIGQQVTVNASAYDPQSLPINYTFSWGDGSPDTTAPANYATHVYSTSDNFTVTVTVTNSLGFSSSASNYIYIAP